MHAGVGIDINKKRKKHVDYITNILNAIKLAKSQLSFQTLTMVYLVNYLLMMYIHLTNAIHLC